MKKILLVAAAAAGIAAASPAFAVDGTINFSGSVTGTTCRINGVTTGPASISVTLPNVSTTSLSTVGATAGYTPFAISLSQCAANTKATTYFEQGGNIDSATGNLKNTASGGAANVQIQLLNGDNTAITLNGATTTLQNSKQITTNASGVGTLNYVAQYIAPTGSAGAGTVTSSVTFTMQYQ